MREDGQRTVSILGRTPGAERVLVWDDFEGLLKWGSVAAWGTPRISKSGNAAFDGSWGLQVLATRTEFDGYLFTGAGRSFSMVRDGVLRGEAVMMLPAAGGQDGFGIGLDWTDGENKYFVRVVYEKLFKYFMWWGGVGGWIDSGLPLVEKAVGSWHRVWFEIDLVRKEYVRIGIDGEVVDLGGEGIHHIEDSSAEVGYVILIVAVYYGGRRSVYFDDVFVGTV